MFGVCPGVRSAGEALILEILSQFRVMARDKGEGEINVGLSWNLRQSRNTDANGDVTISPSARINQPEGNLPS